MKTHELQQGTPQWHAYRAAHFNASDAPAMMGCSPYKTRSQLLHELHTGTTPDVDASKQRLFDDGHRFEALARPLAEQIIGADLYPVTGSEGKLSASFDGLTMAENIAFEHKSLNEGICAAFESAASAGAEVFGDALPMHYQVQMEQQLAVSGADAVLFMATKWEGETLLEKRVCWYHPNFALREQIMASWAQFERDLAAYVPPEAEPVAPVGKAPETLPALRIEISGSVTASNLAEFKATALAAIRAVKRDLTTDQDFADADKAVKWCSDVESRLSAAKEHALSQTASIDALFKTIDDIAAEARTVRLELDKLVTKRKAEIKDAVLLKARQAFYAHVSELDAEIAPIKLTVNLPDFVAAAKNKRTLATLQDAVDTELANGKIAADAMGRDWRSKLDWFGEEAADHRFLFSDLQQLIGKPADDFKLAVTARIEKHKADEAARKEREDSAKKVADAALLAAAAPAVAAIAQVLPLAPQPRVTITSTGGSVVPPMGSPRADEPATLKLGTICERLGFTCTAAFVSDTLGIQHTATDKAAKLYRESDFGRICAALVDHIGAMDLQYAA